MSRQSTPTVSVVVPLYNKERFVARCIASVLAQTFSDFELIIIDDGSTDTSEQIVRAFNDDRIRLCAQPNRGVGAARNEAIDNASGNYIAFLDADDEWRPEHLRVLLRAMTDFPDAVVVCDEYRGEGLSFSKALAEVGAADAGAKESQNITFDYLAALTAGLFVASCSSTMVRRKVLSEKSLRFKQDMHRGEDLNFWTQLSRCGAFVYCDYPGAIYHRQDVSSQMNAPRLFGKPLPDFFSGFSSNEFSSGELSGIKRFMSREYLKNAFNNRGSGFRSGEAGGATLWSGTIIDRLSYVVVRFLPEWLFSFFRRIR